MAGQLIFASRFAVQWIASEKQGRSIVPPVFWVLSLIGSLILLVYAIERADPVFVLGQSGGFVIYARNLALLRRGTA
jgi:lipid-A-disaccharide synthase-like uncharacterized protein